MTTLFKGRPLGPLPWESTEKPALQYCQQALGLIQEVGDTRGEAGTWDSIGVVYHHLGRYTEAVAAYERALGTWTIRTLSRSGRGSAMATRARQRTYVQPVPLGGLPLRAGAARTPGNSVKAG